MKVLFWLALTCVVLTPALAAQQNDNRLSLDKYLDWEEVREPRISPDGEQVIYTRRWVDKINDKWESSLWLVNADGSKNRFLVDGSAPQWSPDGTRIAFLAEGEPEGPQIFVRWMDDEGATTQITRVMEPPSDIRWSPDGQSIALVMRVPTKKDWQIDMPEPPEGAQWTESPRIVESMDYKQDRTGFLEDGFEQIFMVTADGGTPRQLTSGDWDHSSPSWTPNGQTIVFSSLREEEADYQWRESEIYAVDVQTGDIRQLTQRHGPDSNPLVSPDGRRVAYAGYDFTDDTYIETKLYVMDLDGSNPRMIAEELGRFPGNMTWAADSKGVYFNAAVQGTENLHFASLDGKGSPRDRGGAHARRHRRQSGGARGGNTRKPSPAGGRGRLRSSPSRGPSAAHRRQHGCARAGRARRGGRNLVRLVRWAPGSGVDHQTAGLRFHSDVSADALDPRWTARDVRCGLQLRLAESRGERLRRPLYEPAGERRLRQRVRQRDQVRLPEQGLRGPDGRGGRDHRARLHRHREHVRLRLQRRRAC